MRSISRRNFLAVTAGIAALPLVPRPTWAQTYPSRPVRIIVPFPAGNATDLAARLVGQSLSERLKQPFVIENRPGAGGNLGIEAIAKAAADGYSLGLLSPTATIAAALEGKPELSPLNEIAPIGGVGKAPYVVTLTPSFPAATLPEFIAYAKANPGKINFASAGPGSANHLCGELFKALAKVDILHVPYRSSFLPDLLSGQVDVAFAPISLAIEQIRAGKLRALAVTTATRAEALPDVPTVAEFVPGYDISAWYGIGAPKNIPTQILETLSNEIAALLRNPQVKQQLGKLGAEPMPLMTAEFSKFLAEDMAKWGVAIKSAHIGRG